MSERTIRDKCSYIVCQGIKKNESKAVLEMADTFGEWSHTTGWSGEIYCTTCGRRVEYVGNICESKADVEKKLRFLWHMANETVDNTCEFTPDSMMDDRLWFACSNCGGYITTDYGMPSYCPHCGAKVVGE